MQVYFVLQKELLRAGVLELDALFPFLMINLPGPAQMDCRRLDDSGSNPME